MKTNTSTRVIWTVAASYPAIESVHDREQDAIEAAREMNAGLAVPRYQVERSLVIGGRIY